MHHTLTPENGLVNEAGTSNKSPSGTASTPNLPLCPHNFFKQSLGPAGSISNDCECSKLVCLEQQKGIVEAAHREFHVETGIARVVWTYNVKLGREIPPHELKNVSCFTTAIFTIKLGVYVLE